MATSGTTAAGCLLGYDDFNHLCGTSLIIRSDLYGLPERFEDASLEWIKTMLGGHTSIAEILAERGAPLATLPFRGAVYRVAHGGSHSQTPSLLVQYFLNRAELRRPKRMLRNASRLRLVGRDAKREFFGRRLPANLAG